MAFSIPLNPGHGFLKAVMAPLKHIFLLSFLGIKEGKYISEVNRRASYVFAEDSGFNRKI